MVGEVQAHPDDNAANYSIKHHPLEGASQCQKCQNVCVYTHTFTHTHTHPLHSIKYSNPLALEQIIRNIRYKI